MPLDDAARTLLGRTPREHLQNVLTQTDRLAVNEAGDLCIAGHTAEALLEKYGSPLYVVSEETLRANFRRIDSVFREAWPGDVVVMFAIKANNNPAIRAIIHGEGGGGDCFGFGEMYATFEGGADPNLIAMNGGNKSIDEMRAAVERKIIVNIDAVDEIDLLKEICADLSTDVRVCLRIKSAPASLKTAPSDYMGVPDNAQLFLMREKWGLSRQAAIEAVKAVLETPGLQLGGFNIHTPRFTQDPELFAECTRDFAETIVAIRDETGYTPDLIDIGGGWPRERDPESRGYALNPHTIEAFAKHVAASMLNVFKEGDLPTPELRLEPGRYIIGNAVTLLGRIGVVKRDCGMIWVNTDFSTNNLVRIDTAKSAYHIMPASGMDRDYTQNVQIVGPTCIDSRMADDWPTPDVARDDPMAVLDAGMYSESTATQFNSVPRPATVLIGDGAVDIIRERETVEDVYAKTRVPERLRKDGR
ncbi:MAG: diaminopimelate decarboxylase [Pseudomonadota bacterium]